jgi:hypothetical protein
MSVQAPLSREKRREERATPVTVTPSPAPQPDADQVTTPSPLAGGDWERTLTHVDLARPAITALQRTHGNAHVSRLLQRVGATMQRSLSVTDAKRWIKEASDGPGTDEDKIYDAIRQCTDRAALKADPDVQKMLNSELSGHDLWKAQLLLEFGKESAFPATVRAIWSATKGWGTDEERIYKAIHKLTASQLDDLLKIPGLERMLKSELNKGEMKKATGGAGFVDRHKKNVAFMSTLLADMKKPGSPLLDRNTAEWIVPSGGGAAKLTMFVLTKTHDSAARAKKQGKTGQLAYFGSTHKFPSDNADYDLNITSSRGIYFTEVGVTGEQSNQTIWLMEPKQQGAASVRGTLVHETQHDADKHDLDPDWSKAFKSPEESWVRYRTEFRAYWIDGDFDSNSTKAGTASDPKFNNAKQEAIFLHMYGSGPNDVYAVWLRPNYDGNKSVGGQKFQDLVHGYTHPEGVNLINSPRIDDLYNQLKACKKSDKLLGQTPLKELKAAAQALNADDQLYLSSSRAATFQKMMRDNLAAKPRKRIATIVNGGTLPKWF